MYLQSECKNLVIPKSCCVHFTFTSAHTQTRAYPCIWFWKFGETGDRKLYMKPDYHRINVNNSVMCQNLNGNNIYPGHGMVASCIHSVNHLYEMPHRTEYPNWSECHNWFLIEFPSDSCVSRILWTWMIHADAYESHSWWETLGEQKQEPEQESEPHPKLEPRKEWER